MSMHLSTISPKGSETGAFPFTEVQRDDTLEAQRKLGKALRLSCERWSMKNWITCD